MRSAPQRCSAALGPAHPGCGPPPKAPASREAPQPWLAAGPGLVHEQIPAGRSRALQRPSPRPTTRSPSGASPLGLASPQCRNTPPLTAGVRRDRPGGRGRPGRHRRGVRAGRRLRSGQPPHHPASGGSTAGGHDDAARAVPGGGGPGARQPHPGPPAVDPSGHPPGQPNHPGRPPIQRRRELVRTRFRRSLDRQRRSVRLFPADRRQQDVAARDPAAGVPHRGLRHGSGQRPRPLRG